MPNSTAVATLAELAIAGVHRALTRLELLLLSRPLLLLLRLLTLLLRRLLLLLRRLTELLGGVFLLPRLA